MKTNKYNTADDFRSATDYIKYLHSGNVNKQGWICRAQKQPEYKQFHYSHIDIMKQDYLGEKNVYLSMNSFCAPKRAKDTVNRLSSLYVDLDIYKFGITKDAALFYLYNDEFDINIPRPTFVIDSGRGLYLIWKIDEDPSKASIWQRITGELTRRLAEYGSDPACVDTARILRVPFTINSKSGTEVKILDFYSYQYSLAEISEEYDIAYNHGQVSEKQRSYATYIANKKGIETPDFESYSKTSKFIKQNIDNRDKTSAAYYINNISEGYKSILYGRIKDIESLFTEIRKGKDCKREIGLFLYRLWMIELSQNYQLALKATLVLNSRMDSPFSEEYVKTHTYSAEKRIKEKKTYRYKKRRILEILEITEEEEKNLKCLTNKIADKSACNRRYYLKCLKEMGKSIKKDALQERRAEIKEMLEAGYGNKEICEKLKISLATLYRDKAIIANDKVRTSISNALKEERRGEIEKETLVEEKNGDARKKFSKIQFSIYGGGLLEFFSSGVLVCILFFSSVAPSSLSLSVPLLDTS